MNLSGMLSISSARIVVSEEQSYQIALIFEGRLVWLFAGRKKKPRMLSVNRLI
jgi:hypothetical protein